MVKPYYHPNRIDCRCGCCGVREYHEAGMRIRSWLREKLDYALEPVTIGKQSKRVGFGQPKPKPRDEWNLPVNPAAHEARA